MAQENSNPEMKNNVEVNDELGQQIVETNKEQLLKEIELFTNNIEELDKQEKNYNDQWLIDKELLEIQMTDDNHELVTPTYKYQTLPRFWELVKKKTAYRVRQETHLAESSLKGFVEQRKVLIEQLESSSEKLKELEGD